MKELKASEKHYYDSFVKLAECYGGPLDTDKTIDSEGILAYIRGVRILHDYWRRSVSGSFEGRFML